MGDGAPDYTGISEQVMHTGLYEEAMKELGVTHGGRDDSGFALFDGVQFDPTKPDEYAMSFSIKNARG
jgi:nitrate/nitrite transport system substrate-binding protein